MINMIKADFYRAIRSKGIYIAFIIMILMIAIDVYLVEPGGVTMQINTSQLVENEVETEMSQMTYEEIKALSVSEIREMMLNTKGYALDKDILACNMNLYYLFIFVVAIIIAADFSGSTVKNTLSSAISKNKYFISKLTFVSICCLVLFFMNTYIMYFANIIFNGKNLASSIDTITKITLLQLPPILAFISILTGLAFILKKVAAFNTVVIPLMMVLQALLNLGISVFKLDNKLFDYDLQVMLIKLTRNPSNNYILHSYLMCGAIIIIFNMIGYMSFKKAEIK